MIKFYVGMIGRNAITLEQVPALWRDKVAQELGIVPEEEQPVEETVQ